MDVLNFIQTVRNWAEGHFPNNFMSLIQNWHQSLTEIVRKRNSRITSFMDLDIKILKEKYEHIEFLQNISDKWQIELYPRNGRLVS